MSIKAIIREISYVQNPALGLAPSGVLPSATQIKAR